MAIAQTDTMTRTEKRKGSTTAFQDFRLWWLVIPVCAIETQPGWPSGRLNQHQWRWLVLTTGSRSLPVRILMSAIAGPMNLMFGFS